MPLTAQTDPRFIYANKAALDLWEANWDQLIGMPSRLSAAPSDAVQQVRSRPTVLKELHGTHHPASIIRRLMYT